MAAETTISPEAVRWVLLRLAKLKQLPLPAADYGGSIVEARSRRGFIARPTERRGVESAQFSLVLDRLSAAIGGLDQLDRTVLTLRIRDGMTRRAVGKQLKIGAVRLGERLDAICEQIAENLSDLDAGLWSFFCRVLRGAA